jgi:microcompartment protein CcmK/EutM
MKIARVIGTVVASQIADRLGGPTYLLVEPATTSGDAAGGPMVAVDAVQAGEGDLVLVSQGSSCRQIRHPDLPDTVDKAVDALVVGVIDLVDDGGEVTYRSATPAREAEAEDAGRGDQE